MDYLPLFVRLADRPVLVVGGGVVALRKVEWLRKAGARVTLVALELHPELAQQAAAGELEHVAAEFTAELLGEAVAVVAATSDETVNRRVSAAAQARGVPVNVVDDAELSTFIFPAIIEREPVLVAVSSAGHSPVLARLVRAQIEALLPTRLGALARFLGEQRRRVHTVLEAGARRRFWERLIRGPVAGHVLAGNRQAAEQTLARELASARAKNTDGAETGEVYLIGAGPGDPDLLTLRAVQLLQEADVILYDRLVTPEILERARRDAERIFVGKESGESGQQERIHDLMVSLARAGKRVARLKGGDPFIFGRGGEEIEVLRAHGIPYRIVPGITAALGAAASAHLPLTHRRHAHSVTLVNGHQDGDGAADWRYYTDPRHTVVFYMAVGALPGIVARLRAAGATADHPAAIVERATLPGQRIVTGTLATIASRAVEERIAPPALLVVGEIAAFSAAARVPHVMGGVLEPSGAQVSAGAVA